MSEQLVLNEAVLSMYACRIGGEIVSDYPINPKESAKELAEIIGSHEDLRRQLANLERDAFILAETHEALKRRASMALGWARAWKLAAKERVPADFVRKLGALAERNESRLAIAKEAIASAQSVFSEERVKEEALAYNAYFIFAEKARALAEIEEKDGK